MKKFVIYTAVFGQTSRFRMPELSIPDTDRFCFTDLDLESHFYEVKKMNLDYLLPVRRNRLIKILIPNELFNNYEYSFYLDCKHPTSIDFDWLLRCMEPGSDFLVRRHRQRDCVYDEGRKCIKKRKDSETLILKQLEFYRSENYPAHNGLHAAFWLFRRHTNKLREFSKLWWEQVEKYSLRDQISLPYVAWKHGMKISTCERSK